MQLRSECHPAKYRIAFLSTAAALVLVAAPFVNGQTNRSQIIGSVSDVTGARIEHVSVEVVNVQTGVRQAVFTNRTGNYQIPNLIPGSYLLIVSATSFSSKTVSGITLVVGGQQVIDVSLSAGGKTETVEVAAAVQGLQLSSSAVSGLVTGETIRELPLNARSFTDLTLLQPGVAPVETQTSFQVGSDRGTRGFGNQYVISGARPQQNVYLLDGTAINDYANTSGAVNGGNLGVDAIAEFSVIVSNAPAEYGRTGGGVLNAVTRSGTNQFHETGYEFARNSFFDAQNFFHQPTDPPADLTRNQFGGAVGGPIKKDRTFFFGNYEGLRETRGATNQAFVPTQTARAGLLHKFDPVTGAVVGSYQVAVDPSAAKYLPFWQLPNASGGSADVGIYNFSAPQITQEDFVVGRVDHRLAEQDSLSGTYQYDRSPYTYPDQLNSLNYLSKTSRQILAIQESHSFSSTLQNTLRLGLNRNTTVNNVPAASINPAVSDPTLGAVPGQDAAQVGISGGITGFAGGSGASGINYAWTSYQLNDDLSLVRGKHFLKAGYSMEVMRLNIFSHSVTNGQFQFSSLENFLTNKPLLYDAAVLSTISPRNLQQLLFAGYAQDEWRATPTLTLNFGVRYEMTTVPHEAHGRLSSLRNLSDATPHIGDPFFNNPTLKNVAPRVGFAALPFGSKTVIHGAFSIYDVLPLPYLFTLPAANAAPFLRYGLAFGNLPQGSFYAGANALLGPFTQSGAYIQPSPKRNYVMEYSLNVQHEFPGATTLTVGYVGTRGFHQPFYSNQYNIVLPTKTAQGYQWPIPIGSGTKVNPNYGGIRGLSWVGDSYYDGLQVGATKNMRQGVQLQVSYTWSKSIDNTSSSVGPDQFSNSVSTLPFFDPSRSRGPSDFNIGRVLVVSGVAKVPGLINGSRPVKVLTSGWQVGSILSAHDGVPFTPTYAFGSDPLGAGGLQDYPNRVVSPECSSVVNARNYTHYVKAQCFTIPALGLLGNAGRNSIVGPGFLNLDSSVFKNVSLLRERVQVQLRAEAFNILNHTNFALPALSDVTIQNAGAITQTQGTGREMQFGVKASF